MLKNYCSWQWQTVHPHLPVKVGRIPEEAFTIEAVPVSAKPPLYVHNREPNIWEVGLILQNEQSGKRLAYFPTLADITPAIEDALWRADILMVDGTFWSEDELVKVGATERGANKMGHMPIGGEAGTAERLKTFPAERKIFIHINNSNPILRKDAEERHTLEQLGFEIAYDGMELEV